MYNAWSRSTLQMPDAAEADFICAPPYHSASFTGTLLVIPKSAKRGFVLNVASTEPKLAVTFDLLPSANDNLGVSDVAWGPDGKFYLLRTQPSRERWRIDCFQLKIQGRDEENERWTVRSLTSWTNPNFSATSLAVQSRLGGIILGTTTGKLFHKYDDDTFRQLGRWCDDSFVQITKIKRDRLIACVSGSGKLSLALASSNPTVLELCPGETVATVSFSHELPTLAAGLTNSPPRVRLFEYGWESNRVVATATRELVVFGPSLVEEERWLGGVRDLDFGTGSSVACLFHGRTEPIVFHAISGRRTTSGSATVMHHHHPPVRTSMGSPSPILLTASPLPMHRQKLSVGARNHSLTWTGSSLFFINDTAEVCREGFSRHAAQAALCRNDAARFAVLGPDYCSLLSLEGNPKWTRYDCPSDYVSRHGPLSKVAIDDDKSRIAVAGSRGFCVFFAQTRKWKTFQSQSLESRLIIQGMFWLPHHLCVVAQANGNGSSSGGQTSAHTEWELQLYDVDNNRLDVPPVFTSGPLHAGPPVAVDYVRGKNKIELIVLLLTGIQVFEFTFSATSGEVRFKPVTFVARPPSAELGFVTHLALVPSKLESVLPRCVLLDSAGRCAVISLETQEAMSLSTSQIRVSDAWTKLDPTLGVIVWTISDRGLKLWVPSLDPNGELFQVPIMDISFPEVGALPVGSDEDAFVCFQSHMYDVRASKSPILHGVLGWLLRRGRDGLARRVLAERRFSKSARLVRAALEDLLQGALLGENQVDVRKVVNLLGCVPFEVMAAVVARCARQIDVQLWDVLFSIVGAPTDLFQQCLVRFDSSNLSTNEGKRNELILIAAELLPIVDADKDDPPEGPAYRAKQVLKRCGQGSTLEKEVRDYADKRGLDISFRPGEDGNNGGDRDSDVDGAAEDYNFTQNGNGVADFENEANDEDGGGVMSSVIRFLSGF